MTSGWVTDYKANLEVGTNNPLGEGMPFKKQELYMLAASLSPTCFDQVVLSFPN